MRGTIAKKGNAYYVVHDVHVDGVRKRKWTRAGRTRAEADDKLAEVLGQVRQGVYVDSARTTLADYLIKTWLPAAKATIKPSTAELYATTISAYIEPHNISGMKLQDVKPPHLNALYATLSTSGSRDGKPLGPKTVRNCHTLLHRAFRDAVKWELLVRNPAESADPPRVSTPEINAWDGDTVRRFLDSCHDDRLGSLWHLIATTGLRRGEALALRWSDVSLPNATVSVSRTASWVGGKTTYTEPKTQRSRRVVPLPPETIAVLRDWRKRQAAERLVAGELYDAEAGLVFADELGAPLPPKRITKAFGRAVERSGLPTVTLHGLRHSFATIALGAGVQTKIVADVLGHSSAQITADTYSHVTEPMTRDASARVAEAMFGRR
jgi:integrase